ncbi:nuclear transport factor 2 family protein [Streptomyces muensis]|uniref:Nuclear transport factor 2 family protein n=1 Tax=Streptomyces muensis TaxID=1077944 RepID=A0A9X1TQH3_STRM4|nr:nuclear transport factor 2 family protein [Streptomyces muensis]MCF1592588.1 nuclear transport factor 2 family protein [Streptomyces muensis]
MAFQALMRRYAFAYTASHDFSQLASLMVDDYVLRMGEHEIHGRDTAYRAATQRQFDQFPGLGFTVHRLVTNGERLALVFTEHGASRRHGGRLAAWRGVSLYRWDGTRLLDCRVEQDYFARRRQLTDGVPDPVGAPGHDPWSTPIEPENPAALESVLDWLRAGGLDRAPIDRLDDGSLGAAALARPVLTDARHTVLDAFSAGALVPFAVRVDGVYDGGLPELDERRGTPASLYCTGVAEHRVDGGGGRRASVRLIEAVTDRAGLVRRLTSGRPHGK